MVGDLDGSCSIEEQCILEFTTCAGEEGNFKCMCQEDYVKNAAKNGCVKSESKYQKFKPIKIKIISGATLLEESCEVQEQCLGIIDSECSLSFNECRCITSHVANQDLDMCLPSNLLTQNSKNNISDAGTSYFSFKKNSNKKFLK